MPKFGEVPPQPKPGQPGSPIMGIAEQERLNNPDPGPSLSLEQAQVEEEILRLTGKTIEELTEEEFMRLPVKLTAQNYSIATELDVKMKDPSFAPRWFNRKHKDGMLVQQARLRGWQPCTKDDVELSHASITDDAGSLVMGDLVLLKKNRLRHLSDLKGNAETAKYRVSRQAQKPFASDVKGIDNSAYADVHPYQISQSTAAVDPVEARTLAGLK